MIEEDLELEMLINQANLYNNIFRAADELVSNHPMAIWQRPVLRLVGWWADHKLAEILDVIPPGRRNEALGIAPEEFPANPKPDM